MHASRQEVVLHNGLTKPEVTLLGTIAMKCILVRHVVDSLMHRLNDGGAKRLRNITNAQADNIGLRVGSLESIHLLGYVGKEIVLL